MVLKFWEKPKEKPEENVEKIDALGERADPGVSKLVSVEPEEVDAGRLAPHGVEQHPLAAEGVECFDLRLIFSCTDAFGVA